jgi:hypothetical protein
VIVIAPLFMSMMLFAIRGLMSGLMVIAFTVIFTLAI